MLNDLNDPDYIKRRDFLLKRIKRERWVDIPESEQKQPKPLKTKSKRIVNIDKEKPRNKNISRFLNFDE